jgi:hypothetical protein
MEQCGGSVEQHHHLDECIGYRGDAMGCNVYMTYIPLDDVGPRSFLSFDARRQPSATNLVGLK